MARSYVLMSCDVGSENEVISLLKNIEEVKAVHGIFGLYDLIAQMEADTEERINNLVTNTIRKIPKINSTVTLTRSESEDLFKSYEKSDEKIFNHNSVQAYIVMYCDRGEEYTTLKNLSHIPEIREADVVFGYYDIVCKIETSNEKILNQIITKTIRTLPHVKTSMTLNVIN